MGECLGCRSGGSSIHPRLLLPQRDTRRALPASITLSKFLERFCSLVVDAHAEKLVNDIAKGKQGIKRSVKGRSKTGPKRKKGGKLC
jgi:hypothetical protein